MTNPLSTVILASQSPRRQQLLQWAEIPFEVVVSHTDELVPDGMPVSEVPVHLALEKAQVVQAKLPPDQQHWPIVAADTIVVHQGDILGKPADAEEAMRFLQRLSGDQHEVITGVAILQGDKKTCFHETTKVQFHSLTIAEIAHYVNTYQPYDKAGAYAIQEWIGVAGIRHIEGDFYNVMGLPISRVYQALRTL